MNQLSMVCRSDPILLITKSQNNEERKKKKNKVGLPCLVVPFFVVLENRSSRASEPFPRARAPRLTALQEREKGKEREALQPLSLQSCHDNARLLFNLHSEEQPPPPAITAAPTGFIKNAEFKLISDIWPFAKLSPALSSTSVVQFITRLARRAERVPADSVKWIQFSKKVQFPICSFRADSILR